ncbi:MULTISPECIES: hypothetical protein [Pseudanabaena]|uniref:Uncharacterized protein n=2 Tax=Pseudanabaena TaxID=1152 RepID=L8N3N9_9CYAN|nr:MULTISPECIES: hypothetical protein [Pseudanabaena]ELS34271.1 hypothetical protein Pse7429DRAFT_0563 [Pseudanabaena biceps PCC 7429]MDG3493494.1 hypothetical protein [Pseudanabaena catenata USMAC16]
MLKNILKSLVLIFVIFQVSSYVFFALFGSTELMLPSPSGKFLTLVKQEKELVGEDRYRYTWVITIFDEHNNTVYKDDGANFTGVLNSVSVVWDANDRVWAYNYEDGRIFFWERVSDKWVKTYWGGEKEKETSRNIYPPASLYPPHRPREPHRPRD